jgi:hypothetical protein
MYLDFSNENYSSINEFKELSFQIAYLESIPVKEREKYYRIFHIKYENMPTPSIIDIMVKENKSLEEVMYYERKIQGVESIKGARKSRIYERIAFQKLDNEINYVKQSLLESVVLYSEAIEEILFFPESIELIINDLERKLSILRYESDKDKNIIRSKELISNFYRYISFVRDTNIL